MNFNYSGKIESSKSIVNRALILQALLPNLNLEYLSHAEDVLSLENCLKNFHETKTKKSHDYLFDVGSGGTTFRFFSLFLSRHPGVWIIKMSEQLSKRPHQDLLEVLRQLGVDVEITQKNHEAIMTIKTQGWLKNFCKVDLSRSSQFLSGILLSAVDLKKVFEIECLNRNSSSGYETITLDLLRKIGISFKDHSDQITIQPLLKLDQEKINLKIGADWSSVISILCFCFSGSNIQITNIDLESKEPDLHGLEYLKSMGLVFQIDKDINSISLKAKPSVLKPLNQTINLEKNPDLFPMLSALASQIALNHNCEVMLKYPEQLIYKESDRLNAMINILTSLGFEISNDKSTNLLKIKSSNKCNFIKLNTEFEFKSESDHRLVMCFELLKSFGYDISYNHPECVKKSFNNFFEIING